MGKEIRPHGGLVMRFFRVTFFIHESSTLCLLRDLIYGRLSICMRFGFLTLLATQFLN